MKKVYIVGEDPVTLAIINKILSVYAPNLQIIQSLPARGSEIKKKISNFNQLSQSSPVILLTDLDTDDCAPALKDKLLKGMEQHTDFILNIAVDEAEAWLMADRENFASFLNVKITDMPESALQKQGGRKPLPEMSIPIKASYYLTHALALKSTKTEIREQIAVVGKSCKGKEYNSTLLPFIKNQWNISVAMENSDSLKRMVSRIVKLNEDQRNNHTVKQ